MRRLIVPLALGVGIAAVSTGSVLVRYAQETAPSIVVAAARLGIATLLLAPMALVRHRIELRTLAPAELGLALLAGLFLALHFATWIASLEHTSVTSSVVLVTTTPLWVALLAPLLLKERLAPRTLLGIVLALAGSVAIGLADAGGAGALAGAARAGTGHALHGDLLALSGAWMMAGYLLAGRQLRRRMPLVPYVFLVYGMAALVLLLLMFAAGRTPIGLPARTWGWLALLALVPQLIGHSTFNWGLRHIPATLVALAMMGEPVGSSVLAYLLLGEVPAALTIFGGIVVLTGIGVAARAPAPPRS